MTQPILIATAGHVDHGKSTLVKALTGTDPDRWEEEKQRGITIDLGYAHAVLNNRVYSFVDVPGHEKFIHNMLAGIGSIDAVLFVIAADESIMPQTREHARALSFLGVEQVCVVLTKIDLVDEELLELLREEVTEWLADFGWENAPSVSFSAKMPETREAVLKQLAAFHKKLPGDTSGFRLSIDRVFTSPGSGTVITGTVERGNLTPDAPVYIQPHDVSGRIRQLQVHGQTTDQVGPHTRTAINLSDVHYKSLHRGDQIFGAAQPATTTRVLVRLSHFEEDWKPGPRHQLHLHHLAAKVLVRVMWQHGGYAMLALSEPYCFWALDRGLLRDGSPLRVIAGFEVLDPHPRRVKWKHIKDVVTQAPQAGDLAAWQRWFLSTIPGLVALDAVVTRCGEPLLPELRDAMVQVGKAEMMRTEVWESYHATFIEGLKLCHKKHPLFARISLNQVLSYFRDKGWSTELTHKIMEAMRDNGTLLQQGDRVSYVKHRVHWKDKDLKNMRFLMSSLQRDLAVIDFKKDDDMEAFGPLIDLLLWEKYVVALTPQLLIDHRFLNRIMATLHERFQRALFSIQELKEEFGFSRKYAIPLLEYLDKNGFTRREQEGRTWIAQELPKLQSDWQPP